MRSKLLNLDLAEQAFDMVFRYAEDSNREIYLLSFLAYVIFTKERADRYVGYISSVEQGKENLSIGGAEPLCIRIHPYGATIVFDMADYELPPRHYTLQEVRDALEDWRDFLRERAREKEPQGG